MNSTEVVAAGNPLQEIIVTLQVQEGNKPGQPIGSYTVGRRMHHLVFLPSDAPVGKEVRVRLVDTGRKDVRGNALYRGVPVQIEYSNRWKDNGNGTGSKVTIAKNWLLQEWEEGECEKKELVANSPRPDRATKIVRHKVDFGTSLATATVLEETVVSTPLMDERVDNTQPGGFIWVEVGKREMVEKSDRFAVSRFADTRQFRLDLNIKLNWDGDWPFQLAAYFVRDGSEIWVAESTTWGKLPAWVQTQFQAEWPVCSCGRERVAMAQGHKVDDYPKCSKCRSEAHCDRCNKTGATEKLSFLSNRLVCQSCLPYEKAEQLINRQLTATHKAKVVADAEKLLLGQALAADLGLSVLKAGLGHVTVGWPRDNIVNRWSGYQWYYFTDQGVFGSKFSPATLQILRFIGQATGNGLVEMVAWLAGGQKVDPNWDFFTKTQVKGENGVALPQIEDVIQKFVAGSAVLADRLRGSEKSRLEMLDAVKSVESLRNDDFRSGSFREIQTLMEAEAQEYGQVTQKVAELKALKPPPPPPPPSPTSPKEGRKSRRRARDESADMEAWQRARSASGGTGPFTTSIGDLIGDIKLE